MEGFKYNRKYSDEIVAVYENPKTKETIYGLRGGVDTRFRKF